VTEKTAYEMWQRGARLPGRGLKVPNPRHEKPVQSEGNTETMIYRNICQQSKRLKRIHEVRLVCRDAYRGKPETAEIKTQTANQGNRGNLI
jgi:hypothetical protein